MDYAFDCVISTLTTVEYGLRLFHPTLDLAYSFNCVTPKQTKTELLARAIK